jgi:uncharacterized membrane protein
MHQRLLLVGFLIVLVGFAILILGSSGGNISTGGFILIGPFPIVFGSGANGTQLGALAVVAGILMLVFLFLAASRLRREVAD